MTRAWLAPLAVSLALVGAARAEPAPATPSAAVDGERAYEMALSEALAAHARGAYAAARVAMERAHELGPSARTLRGLGIVAFAQGRHREAIAYLEASLAAAEKPLPAELRSGVEELLGHAWGQVSRLELLLDPSTGDFLLDGAAPAWYAPHVVVLAPGIHTLTARAPARDPFEMTLDAKAGERRTLQVVLAVPLAPIVVEHAVPHVEAPARVAVEPPRPPFWTPRVQRATYAGGAGAVLVGVALWSTAYARLQGIVHDCEQRADGTCSADLAANKYRAANVAGLAIASGVSAGIGLAALIGAAGIDVVRWKRHAGPVHTDVAWSAAGMTLRGRF